MKLICYLSSGYPTIDESVELAKTYARAGCDIIEIDFPSDNAYLESEYISNRMKEALKICGDYQMYMDGLARMKRALPDTQFIIMIYEETLQKIGYEAFVGFCKQNNILDMIFVGLKDEVIKNKLIRDGLRVSCYIQYDLGDEEIAQAKASNGFVYLQAKPTTGKMHPDYPQLKDCIRYLRSKGITAPIYCGVGIHAPEDVKMAKEAGGDGAFVGSAILKLFDDKEALAKTIGEFKAMC